MTSVLVVEDNADLRDMYQEILSGLGDCSVRVAETVADALAALAVERPAVVLLDLGIPGDFPALHTALRDGDGTRVIVASGARDLPERAAALGAAAYLLKPFTPEALLEAVDRVVGSH
jgi:CheY-like chemotaxis protein